MQVPPKRARTSKQADGDKRASCRSPTIASFSPDGITVDALAQYIAEAREVPALSALVGSAEEAERLEEVETAKVAARAEREKLARIRESWWNKLLRRMCCSRSPMEDED